MPALCSQYFAFVLLILIAQVTAGVLFYFNMGKVSTLLVPTPRPGLDQPRGVGGRVGLGWGAGLAWDGG